jgi:hypothetical protein
MIRRRAGSRGLIFSDLSCVPMCGKVSKITRAVLAPGDAGWSAGRLEQVVEKQELGDRQRLAAAAVVEGSQRLGQVGGLPEF